jgi:biopolymer transport protein ExbB/TolQ
MFEDLALIGLLAKGGITIIVLALFSLLSIAIMLEKAWAFRAFKARLEAAFEVLSGRLKSGDVAGAAQACGEKSSPLGNVFLSGYTRKSRGKDEVLRAMELSGKLEIAGLQSRLGIIGTIGATAPFLGLFGTVLGIIRAFRDLSLSGGAGPAVVADGIAEALVTTAAGLLVAIPAVIAYNYFVRSATRHALTLETMAHEFTYAILEDGEEDGLESK